MKTFPLPVSSARRLKRAYDALMLDDLPIDFVKVCELIQSSGVIVRAINKTSSKAPDRVE